MTIKLSLDKVEKFKNFLIKEGFVFEERPYQLFLARKSEVTINLYKNGKIVFTGKNQEEIRRIREYAESLGAVKIKKINKVEESIPISGTRIGTDEVGKGDYFGPLVVGGVVVTEDTEKKLKELGIKDSKTLSDTTIRSLAYEIREILGEKRYEIIWISPIKYNLLHKKLKNINRILGWAHARVIENLLGNGIKCKIAIADQFGDQGFIKHALMEKGKKIELIQLPRAERDIAVATASILARDKFLWKMEELSEHYGVDFPRGADEKVDKIGREFIKKYGIDALLNVAKIHFKNTLRITGGLQPNLPNKADVKIYFDRVPKENLEKMQEDLMLECYNLIMSFERELRKFIKLKLEAYYGNKWWEEGIPKYIREKVEEIIESEHEKGKEVELIEGLNFSHYEEILGNSKNWGKIFSQIFGDKNIMIGNLRIIREIRRRVAHSRSNITPEEKVQLIGAISVFRNLIKIDIPKRGV